MKINAISNTYLYNYDFELAMTPYKSSYGDVYGDGSHVVQVENVNVNSTLNVTGNVYSGNIYPVINIKGSLSVEGNGTTGTTYQIVY